jgi:hypothetical protein
MNVFLLFNSHKILVNVPSTLEMSALANLCYSARLKSQLRRSEVEGNLELPISNSSLLLPLFRTQQTHRASRGHSTSGASRDRMNCTHMVVSATFENLNHVYASEILPIPEPS